VRKILGLSMLLSVTTAVWAQSGWDYLGGNTGGSVYIGSKEFIRSGSVVKVWTALEFNVVPVTGTKRQETYREYDCAKKTSKTLQMKTYNSKGDQTDTINYSLNWHSPVKDGTPDHTVMMVACSR